MTPCISGITDAKDSVRKRLCQEAAFASVQAQCLNVFSAPQEFSKGEGGHSWLYGYI